MLRKADLPFVKSPLFEQVLKFRPDMAVITLGTNDTCQDKKRDNWQHYMDLQADAEDMMIRITAKRISASADP